MKKGKQKIRSHILFPLGFALVILLAISMFLAHLLHMRHINDHTQEHLSNVKKLFETELDEDAQLLSGLINFIQQDKNLQDAWLAKDREALLKYALPVFDNLHTKHNTTHFYFHGLDKVNFLRVHDPPRHSDHIDRFTMAGAANDHKLTWGIELGPLGTFTLRVVSPWQIDGKLVGYIELGEEIEHITVEISELLDIELCSVINKSYLDRNNWEEGMKMLGRRSHWDQFPGFVLSNKTFDKLPPVLSKYLEELVSCKEDERLTDMLEIVSDDHRYQGRFFPLIDAGNQDVGDIIVIAEITKAISELRMFSIMLTLSCLVIALLLFGFFYFYLGRIENKLTHSYNEIQDEIAHREQAETEREKVLHSVGERVKELRCMYGVTRSIQIRTTIEEIFQDVAELIPGGWHYPEITRARIIFKGQEYVSEPFEETRWKQSSDIIVNGQTLGSIEVYYLQECPSLDEGPFMTEERDLVNGIARNISEAIERKQAEDELLRYASIVSSSSDMMAFLDADFIYLAANKAYLAAFGMTKDQVVGHTASQVFGEEFFETTIRPNAERCLEGNTVSYEDWFQFPVYGLRFMSVSYSPFIGPNGDINGFVVNGRDITNRKEAEEELRQSEERFRKSVLESPFPIMIHAEDGEVLQINKVWTELTGYEPEEIPTLSAWTERAYGERKDIVKSRIDKIFDCDTKIEEGEYTIKSKEGKVLIWDFSSAPLGRMPDGRRLVISMAMDVTARKQAEEKEKQHHAELAHASRVNSIGEMASSLAHEINQPLFVMQAQAERSSKLLETGSQNIDTVIDKMQIIMKQADRAEKIISRIRKFVRKGKSVKQKVSLNALIYDSLELLRNDIAYKNIKLQLDLSTDAPEVNTDPVQIEQVIVNLISNSIDALDETLGNERQISIKSSVTEGNAEVRIKDNGSGMSPKEIQIAFDSFYTTKSYGLGIGLSISRTIIESQGGRIGLEANADKGVTSYFTLPVNKAD